MYLFSNTRSGFIADDSFYVARHLKKFHTFFYRNRIFENGYIIIIIITKQLLRKTFTLTQLIWHFCDIKTLVDRKSRRKLRSLCVALQWHGVKNLRGKWWPKIIWRHALFRSIKKRNLHPVDNVFSSKQFSLHYRIFGEYSNPSCPSQWSFASCAVQTLVSA